MKNIPLSETSSPQRSEDCLNTPLVLAVKKGLKDTAIALIHAGADLNIACKDGLTALHWACILRQNDIISELLEQGADPTLTSQYGFNAYQYYNYNIHLMDIAKRIIPYNERHPGSQINMPEFNDLYDYITDSFMDNPVAQALKAEHPLKCADPQFNLNLLINARNQIMPDEIINAVLMVDSKPEHTLEARHQAIVLEQYNPTLNRRDQHRMSMVRGFSLVPGVVLNDILRDCDTSLLNIYKQNSVVSSYSPVPSSSSMP